MEWIFQPGRHCTVELVLLVLWKWKTSPSPQCNHFVWAGAHPVLKGQESVAMASVARTSRWNISLSRTVRLYDEADSCSKLVSNQNYFIFLRLKRYRYKLQNQKKFNRLADFVDERNQSGRPKAPD